MIKPNELFIGAVVNYINGKELLPTILDAKYLAWIERHESSFNKMFQPIPITTEILIDWCGWEDTHFSDQIVVIVGGKTNQFTFKHYLFSNTKHIVFNSERLDHIQYLHQLQSLYQLLTGEQMPIKLPEE